MENFKKKFNTHVLKEILRTEDFKVFEFRKESGCSTYFQRWIIDRGTLIVQGDCYSAIYRWNTSGISLKFLAKCNLDYFNEKCVADKDGSSQKVFDSDYAQEYMKKIAAERIYDNLKHEEFEGVEWDNLTEKERFELVAPIIMRELDIEPDELEDLFYAENPHEAYSILSSKKNEFMFGSDGWEYASLVMCYTPTPKFHLAALIVAYEKFGEVF